MTTTTTENAPKSWAEMSPDERRTARIETWLAAEGVTFESPEAEATYRAGVTRFCDAAELKKIPDRVPIMMNATFMPADLYDVTPHALMYDPDLLTSTFKRFLADYRPDYYFSPAIIGSGQVLETLDYKQYAWPGHGVAKESGYQYNEAEYMATEDYQMLIDDPSDFWLRAYLPRMCGALEPLSRIPALTDLWEIVFVTGHMIPFGVPDVQAALTALMEAGRQALEWAEHIGHFELEVRGMGYVSSAGGISKAPFDVLADTLRGTKSTMLDMRRRPELVLEAIERLTPLAIKQGVAGANGQGNPIVFLPLHKGADGFMSDEQFRTFYWPSLKKVVIGLADEGCIPLLFCEGGYNSRLEYLAELPKGTTVCMFDRTDMRRAKELLAGRVCIAGNVPAGMILTGTADDVRAYCKGLIDDVAPGGGYIMSFGTAMDDGKPDTVHAMIDFTKEYGVYR
jgi:hypothetical protein